LPGESLEEMGRRAAATVALWGPGRFAQGVVEAIELALESSGRHVEFTGLPTNRGITRPTVLTPHGDIR
jgi:hypothetical protein